jgi:hypothetical protein
MTSRASTAVKHEVRVRYGNTRGTIYCKATAVCRLQDRVESEPDVGKNFLHVLDNHLSHGKNLKFSSAVRAHETFLSTRLHK